MPRSTPNVRTVRYPSREIADVVMNSTSGSAIATPSEGQEGRSAADDDRPPGGVVDEKLHLHSGRQGPKQLAVDEIMHVRRLDAQPRTRHRADARVTGAL